MHFVLLAQQCEEVQEVWKITPERAKGENFGNCVQTARSLQSCLTQQPHGLQPTRFPRPWDSPGKNTGVGCHFLLQCMKVKSESEVAQSCPTLSNPMDCSLPGPTSKGFSRQERYDTRYQLQEKKKKNNFKEHKHMVIKQHMSKQ